MTWPVRVKQGLVLGGWLALGCGPSSGDPPVASESSSESGSTTAAEDPSTSSGEASADDSGSGSGDASSTGAPALPCAWVEGQHDAEIPAGTTPSNVTCDPETNTATIRLAFDAFDCGGSPTGDSLRIELPPELQVAGELDLTTVVATVYVSADLEPVTGQVDTGTLVITAVTPTTIVGWAHGGLDGYDFVSSFEAPYCP